MNSCFEPCNRAACGVYADRFNPGEPLHHASGGTLDTCCAHDEALRSGHQMAASTC